MVGRVVDEAGRPLPGIRVTVGYVANGAAPEVVTDASGAVTVDTEFAPAHVWAGGGRDPDLLRERVWLRSDQQEFTLTVRRGARVSGRVLDAQDAPVTAWVEAFDGARQVGDAMADAEGRFSLLVPPGHNVDLQASIPRAVNEVVERKGMRQFAERAQVPPGAADVLLRMGGEPEERSIEVEVVDADGRPVAGASATASFPGENPMQRRGARTGADGRARIDGVPRAPVTLRVSLPQDPVRLPGFTWGLAARRLASTTDAARFVVAAPRVLLGRVVREDGTPCGGAVVNAWIAQGAHSSGRADEEGRFETFVDGGIAAPIHVTAQPYAFDAKAPLAGSAVVDDAGGELVIVVRAVPAR